MQISTSRLRVAFFIGFTVGVVASLAVLFSGSLEVFFTPRWQTVLLFPGLNLGWAFDYCCGRHWLNDDWRWYAGIAIGIVAVGAWYGGIACAITFLLRALGRKRLRDVQL